jgi:hypothetical protein
MDAYVMQQGSWGRTLRAGAAAVTVFLGGHQAMADELGAFHFDLAVNVIGMEADTADAGIDAPLDFDLAGLPVSIAALSDGGDSDNPGISAGLNGAHQLSLGGGFTLASRGSVQKTRYLTDSFFGSDRIAGGTALRFEERGFKGALEPGIDLALQAGSIDRRRYTLDGRLSQDILDGWAVSLGNGWMRQEYPGTPDDRADTGSGRLGFAFTMIEKTRLDLSYEMSRTWAVMPEDGAAKAGPALDLSLSVLDALDIGFRYQHCESTDYETEDGSLQVLVDSVHSVGIHAAWQKPGAEYFTVSAGYNLDHTASPVAARDGITHDAMVSLGLKF